jgi:hypothetical protein
MTTTLRDRLLDRLIILLNRVHAPDRLYYWVLDRRNHYPLGEQGWRPLDLTPPKEPRP